MQFVSLLSHQPVEPLAHMLSFCKTKTKIEALMQLIVFWNECWRHLGDNSITEKLELALQQAGARGSPAVGVPQMSSWCCSKFSATSVWFILHGENGSLVLLFDMPVLPDFPWSEWILWPRYGLAGNRAGLLVMVAVACSHGYSGMQLWYLNHM